MAADETPSGDAADEVAAVLEGRVSYDALRSPRDQALVRRTWKQRIGRLRDSMDLEAEFEAEGRSWVECDDTGTVIERP